MGYIMGNIVNFPNIEAHKKWMIFSREQQKNILENVWCSKCSGIIEITQKNFQVIDQDILIKGYCKNCNSNVARLVETS